MKKLSFSLVLAFVLFLLSTCNPFKVDTPQNLYASVSGNLLTLTWTAVDGAEQYHVFRKMEGYFTSSGSFSEMIDNPTSAIYTENIGGITGTTYTYQVCAEKKGNFSDRATSNSVSH